MALDITDSIITSDVTPETARLLSFGAAWELSWLPTVPLTREQAVSGMVLDEMLSDPGTLTNDLALELAAIRATDLGVTLREVLLRLYARITARDNEASCGARPPLVA
ncbi:hypothetical protein [Nocardia implantans]|uniref:Uncharacterized protein n=1 Tax=Nocardia implantans TaxID=3108168 RepID=A0ABU6ANE1_9NOCA|nr:MULTISPECIES: hypothetical protein [unclassified Nocardia]MBF6192059.1 hypothetical protein [Nocardia beijingensis]MEA3530189.1 hypothetical protein [Nocardia sp. CDC192]MEB3508897.1 hypothetical protein [Nocardia sp. CDC186]